MKKIMRSALPGWKSITNYDYNRLGKFWFCWKDEVVVTLLHKSAQIITCAVQNPVSGEQLIGSAIYASNFIAERSLLLEDIRATRAAQHTFPYNGFCQGIIMSRSLPQSILEVKTIWWIRLVCGISKIWCLIVNSWIFLMLVLCTLGGTSEGGILL